LPGPGYRMPELSTISLKLCCNPNQHNRVLLYRG
jgi:hypothetical protein